MKRLIEERKCDYCGKVVQQSELMFGGSPFNGWIKIERICGSTRIPRSEYDGPWDFCSVGCACVFLNRLNMRDIK